MNTSHIFKTDLSSARIMETSAALIEKAGKKTLKVFKNENLKRGLNFAIILAVVSLLTVKLGKIGLNNILGALPSSPLFYLISILLFFAPIFAETTAYKILTGSNTFKHITIFIRKHVYNEAVMSYAGEVFFIDKLAQFKNIGHRKAAIMVKDVAIIRTLISNLWLLLLIGSAFLLGHQNLFSALNTTSPLIFISAMTLSVMTPLLLAGLFRKFSKLDLMTSSKLGLNYLSRSLVIAILQVFQWSFILPNIPLTQWLSLLIIYAIAKKSPVGGDLVFVTAALSLPSFANGEAALVAMLLASVATTQLLYLGFFVISSAIDASKNITDATLPAGAERLS